jgi:hypothetical protein
MTYFFERHKIDISRGYPTDGNLGGRGLTWPEPLLHHDKRV